MAESALVGDRTSFRVVPFRHRAAIPANDRLIVALDLPTVEDARDLVRQLGASVSFYKIGLRLQFAGGLQFAGELIDQGKKVFLDSKILDIDITVKGAVENVAKMGVSFLTVHGNGSTIKAAIEGRDLVKDNNLQVFSVTVLTSLDADDMKDLGLNCSVEELVMHRAERALAAGADGVIASGLEASKIRQLAGNRLLIVAPGIRSEGQSRDDQRRVTTPSQAIAAGADYLVVGREILRAANPAAHAESIIKDIDKALIV